MLLIGNWRRVNLIVSFGDGGGLMGRGMGAVDSFLRIVKMEWGKGWSVDGNHFVLKGYIALGAFAYRGCINIASQLHHTIVI